MRVLGISEELMQKHVDGDESAMERGENTRQLDVSYRSLSDTTAIASGDRAPDTPLTDAAGNNLRLFDLFRGPHFTLLRFISIGDHAQDGDEILIRPDGYLA